MVKVLNKPIVTRPIARVEQDFIDKQKTKAIWKEANKCLFNTNFDKR